MAEQMIRAIASSSNSSTVSAKKHDVFLSFRGEDTHGNFTSYLYEALMQKKVETYIDYQLKKGDEISPALFKAIEDSRVSIGIFSENYASSKWCLGELSKILECRKDKGQIVIPVFYGIDPSQVRKQTGSYEHAFTQHKEDSRCNEWKTALAEVANLAGWDSRSYRTEPELIKNIVENVLKQLDLGQPNPHNGLVGIMGSYEKIKSLLNIGSSEVKTIGIWGMGGIGKTTLAKALYVNLSGEFEGRCFLENVRENSNNIIALRDKLFSKLLRIENKIDDFDSDIISLRRKKVFVVLDDVDTSKQLKYLIEEYDFLGPGSRVIVTCRNKHILSRFGDIYSVEELSYHHSLELFCLTVFGQKQPKDGYEELSRRVISYCKGIPLALTVLGASLRSRSKEVWECELRKLHQIPNMEIHRILKFSYDGLSHSEKDIFLDIACFFKGETRGYVTSILNAFDFFPTSGIEALLDKALITISDGNRIGMHDLIQEMGWEIVHQRSDDPRRGSRLWRPEEVHEVLKHNRGIDVAEGIILELNKLTGDIHLSSNFFAKMTKLRFLQIREGYYGSERLIREGYYGSKRFDVYLPNGLESLPYKLRILHWDGFLLESLPSNFFCAEQLVELHMPRSKLKMLWDGIQNLMNLKTINLNGSVDLIAIPDLSKAEQLENVHLAECKSLRQLHQSNLTFPMLTCLDLRGCRNIESLVIHSKSLSKLDLHCCSSLKEISMTSEIIIYLNLSYLREIESLILHSKSLHSLDLHGCSSLKEISVKSEKMILLNLADTSIYSLSSTSIGHSLSLANLDLSGTNVESLPTNIKNLSMLISLRLDKCRKLVSLRELPPSLKRLYLNGCKKLVSLQELPPALEELQLLGCRELVSLPELPSSLQELYLNDCRELVSLSKLPPSLKTLC